MLAGTPAAAGCGGSDAQSGGDRQTVVAAFYPLAFAAEQIGGDRVAVTNVTPSGSEPHDIELTPRDAEQIQAADVVFFLGEGFQPAVEQAAEDAGGDAIDLLGDVELRPGVPEGGEEGGGLDPHVWLDPVRYAAMVRRIGEQLGRPDETSAFAAKLEKLDQELEDGLADCKRRELVTSHAAFGYLADRYDLEQTPISGISPEAEPTPRELERVADEVRALGATTVFTETLLSPRLAETVARETGAETAVLNPIEGLTEEEIDNGASYFSVMRANLASLRKALGCR